MLVKSHGWFSTTILKNTAFLGARYGFSLVINFLSRAFIAREIGPAEWGSFSTGLLVIVGLQGTIDLGTRLYVVNRDDDLNVAGLRVIATFQRLIGLVVGCLVAFVVSPLFAVMYHEPGLRVIMMAAGLNIVFFSWGVLSNSLLERRLEFGKLGILEVTGDLVLNTIGVIAVLLSWGAEGFALALLMQSVVPTIMAMWMASAPLGMSFCRSTMNQALEFGFPIWAHTALLLVNGTLSPVLILNSIAGLEALGIIRVAFSIWSYPQLISTLFQRVSFSGLSKIKGDRAAIDMMLHKALRTINVLVIPGVAAVVGLGPWWIPVVYGKEWLPVMPVLLVSTVVTVILSTTQMIIVVLNVVGLAHKVLEYYTLFTVFLWAACSWATFSAGYLGYAVGWSAAIVTGLYLVRLYNRRVGRLSVRSVLIWNGLSILAIGLTWLIAVKVAWWGGAIFAFALLGCLLFLTRSWHPTIRWRADPNPCFLREGDDRA